MTSQVSGLLRSLTELAPLPPNGLGACSKHRSPSPADAAELSSFTSKFLCQGQLSSARNLKALLHPTHPARGSYPRPRPPATALHAHLLPSGLAATAPPVAQSTTRHRRCQPACAERVHVSVQTVFTTKEHSAFVWRHVSRGSVKFPRQSRLITNTVRKSTFRHKGKIHYCNTHLLSRLQGRTESLCGLPGSARSLPRSRARSSQRPCLGAAPLCSFTSLGKRTSQRSSALSTVTLWVRSQAQSQAQDSVFKFGVSPTESQLPSPRSVSYFPLMLHLKLWLLRLLGKNFERCANRSLLHHILDESSSSPVNNSNGCHSLQQTRPARGQVGS